MMKPRDRRSDEDLLAAAVADDAAFSVFYSRYEKLVLAFFRKTAGPGEVAVDLTAEVFAELVESLDRFDPDQGSGSSWLFGIARNVLARSRRRGQVEDRSRRRLGLPLLVVADETIDRIERSLGADSVTELLTRLPDAQRAAIEARILQERDYGEIARELRCSESVVRQRVSRGLRSLRSVMKESP
jgi:RNA polymerase sigma-70 factor (ECF subfamily)